jgi:hypothetical protein
MEGASMRYFLFVGEAGGGLGGMQDYYGTYSGIEAARRAVPAGVDWAEVATVRYGRLELFAEGERMDGKWRWRQITADDADYRRTRPRGRSPGRTIGPLVRSRRGVLVRGDHTLRRCRRGARNLVGELWWRHRIARWSRGRGPRGPSFRQDLRVQGN